MRRHVASSINVLFFRFALIHVAKDYIQLKKTFRKQFLNDVLVIPFSLSVWRPFIFLLFGFLLDASNFQINSAYAFHILQASIN